MDSIFLAKLIALPGPFLLGSYNFTFSQNVMPHLLSLPPSTVTPIFDKIYHRGAATIAPIAALVITANAYLAYKSTGTQRQLHGTAAVLVAATLPLTQIIMMPGISRLIEIGRNAEMQKQSGIEGEVLKLLKTWVAQNYFRASLHVVGGMCGLYAVLS